MRHMMIDFETLDTTPSAHVLTLGACVFSPYDGEIFESFHYRFHDHQPGRTISVATVKWWMEQDAKAKGSLEAGEALPIGTIVQMLRTEYQTYGCEAMWSNGPSFDGAILESLVRGEGLPSPCRYNEHRDVRTVGMLAGERFKNTSGVAHDARSDAIEQALFVFRCYRKLCA